MSDIWVKTASGTSSTTWKKAVKLFVKTVSGSTSAAWSTVKNVYVYFSAGWTRVWPLSGVFSLTSPYITTAPGSTTPLYGVDGVRRVGGIVFGKNGTWNPNGWVINSYQYRWRAYNSSDINDSNLYSQTSLATYSSAISLSIPASYDRKYLSFFIQANSSGGSAYNGFAESGIEYGGIQIVRQQPINLSASLSNLDPFIGNTINWSSSWSTQDSYAIEASRTTIQWYKNLNNSMTDGTPIPGASSYSYVVQTSDLNHYIYAVETAFNSGTDHDLGLNTGVEVKRITSSVVQQILDPQPFTTLSFTKNFPFGSNQGVTRLTNLSWLSSTNATNYRIEYWGSNDNVNWTNVQTFAQSPQQITTSHTASWSSPQGNNFNYYIFMRARVQAANAGAVTVISDGGEFKYADGTKPGQPSFGTITTAASGTASIPVTSSSTQGSNYRYEVMEYKLKTSSGSYPSSWSTQSLSSGAGTISLTGLSNSNSPYYIVIRQRNYDELYSNENETSFNIPAQPVYEVTFNGNGGTLSSGPGNGQTSYTYTGTSGTTFTIPSASRDGYNFSSWRHPQSGGDPQFAGTPGNTYTINSNISYWAQWTATTPSPGAPTGLSVTRSVGNDFLSTSLSPSGSGNSTKTQTWSFGRNTTFTINFTRGSNATSSELYYSTSSSTPSAATNANGGTNTNATGSFSYVGSASTTNNNDYPVYFWVRSTTDTEKSAWTYAGTQDVDTPNYTGFQIRLYRTNVNNANFTTATPSRNDLTYTWTNVSTSFSHQAQVRLTFDGTQRIANS